MNIQKMQKMQKMQEMRKILTKSDACGVCATWQSGVTRARESESGAPCDEDTRARCSGALCVPHALCRAHSHLVAGTLGRTRADTAAKALGRSRTDTAAKACGRSRADTAAKACGRSRADTAAKAHGRSHASKLTSARIRLASLLALLLLLMCALSGCASSGDGSADATGDGTTGDAATAQTHVLVNGESPQKTITPEYATGFYIDMYAGDIKVITVYEDDVHESASRYLLLPAGCETPEDLDSDVTVLDAPVKNIYLAASACMDGFCKIGALDAVKLSATPQNGWYIDEAKEAMTSGDLIYAGKYSAPDYELLLSNGCELAVESTMIYHTPEVKEQLEENGIPVLIDRSSYEEHPLGRVEWIKLYGALTGHDEEAESVFDAQKQKLETVVKKVKSSQSSDIAGAEQSSDAAESGSGASFAGSDGGAKGSDALGADYTGGAKNVKSGTDTTDSASTSKQKPTVAFFYITSQGNVNVRKADDYVARTIELAGGRYVPDFSADKDDKMTENITLEDFYAEARDADYLVYNATITADVRSLADLLSKSELLEDFAAVKSSRVYIVERNMYQQSTEVGTMTEDFYNMMAGDDGSLVFLKRLL